MTVILRLQGLDVTAGTEDIRTFFECFQIHEGGVYIVGGSLREAFIAFKTERDAQLAMRCSGNFLKGSKVSLHISSMTEMEHKLQSLLKKKKPSSTRVTMKSPKPTPGAKAQPRSPVTADTPPSTEKKVDPNTARQPPLPHPDDGSDVQSLDSNTAFLLGVYTVLQGLQSSYQRDNAMADPRIHSSTVAPEVTTPEQTLNLRPGYVRVFGLPASTTKEVIYHFFKGLTIQDVILNVKLGLGHGCLVKFANTQHACDALLFNQRSLGPNCVEVRGASEKMWTCALQERENALGAGERVEPKQSPLIETANHKQKPTCALQFKRQSINQLSSEKPKKQKPHNDTSMEYHVVARNLPKQMTKTEIKELFGCPNISHKKVLHLLDMEGKRTDKAFLIFDRHEDYDYAMNLTGCYVGPNAIEVSSITRMEMTEMMAKTHPRNLKNCLKAPKKKRHLKRKSDPVETPRAPSMSPDPTAQTCLFLRNMPADVQKSQVESLFRKYKLRKDNIFLLSDRDGKGIGEAVVQFKSQKLATLAQRLHGHHFLGTNLLLTCINVKQMEDILACNV